MSSRLQIMGFAVVTVDGMLADAAGVMPSCLLIEGDQEFFKAGLNTTAAVIHGRHSQEPFPGAAERKRLIATRSVSRLEKDPDNPNAMLWNPQHASYEEGLAALGVTEGIIGIIGGTEIFGFFLPYYDVFQLSRAGELYLPGGRPVFPQVPALTPEDVLTNAGLTPHESRVLDASPKATLRTWRR